MARGRQRKNSPNVMMKSAEFIGWALGGLEREIAETRERLASLNAQAARLRARIGSRQSTAPAASGGAGTAEAPATTRRRPRISAEGRKRIAEAQRKRWAEARKKKGA